MTMPARDRCTWKVVIVGGGVASWRAAAELRRRGHVGEVIVIGGGTPLPYDRPPLSKEFLTSGASPEAVALVSPTELDTIGVTYLYGERAGALDVQGRKVMLQDGGSVDFDALIIATGTAPIELRLAGATLPGVHTLRSLTDASRLRDALTARPRVAVVGGGFIGCEFAASCRVLGLEVTVVEAAQLPLSRQMGEHFGNLVASLHHDAGVQLRCNATVTAICGHRRAEGLELAGGECVEADVVVVGVGSVPQDAWLAGSGVEIGDGVLVDEHGCADVEGIYAAGDVARWHSTLLGQSVRVEHWTNAVEQGRVAARNLMAERGPTATIGQVPYFWTDQFTMRAQLIGFATGDECVVPGPAEGAMGVAYAHRGGLVGVLAVNWPQLALAARRVVGRDGAVVSDGALFDAAVARVVAAAS